MNFQKWEYHESNLPEAPAARTAFLEQLKIKFKNELLASEAARTWLSQYHKDSIENFINNYINVKLDIVQFTKAYINLAEKIPELQYRQETENTLDMILQKKLFNVQCQWRAEMIELPGISICQDFVCWEKDIRNCPFIEPVTEQELELMRRYVLSDSFNAEEVKYPIMDWQEYEELTKKEEDGLQQNMPEWYNFYDTYMGTGDLLLLPDIRGRKEDYYIAAYFKEQKRRSTIQQPAPPYKPTEWLSYSIPLFYEMACQFDDAYFQALIKARRDEEAYDTAIENEEGSIEEYIEIMKNITDLPPVRGGLNWRDALRRCYQDYVNSIIYRDLPAVWEEYMLYRSMGIQAADTEDSDDKIGKTLCEIVTKQILEGRAILGEPRDLNF